MHYCSTQSQMLDQTNLWFLSCCETGEIKFRLMIMLQDVYPKNKMFCWGIIKNCKVFFKLNRNGNITVHITFKGRWHFHFLIVSPVVGWENCFSIQTKNVEKGLLQFCKLPNKVLKRSNSIMKTIVPAILYEYFVDN